MTTPRWNPPPRPTNCETPLTPSSPAKNRRSSKSTHSAATSSGKAKTPTGCPPKRATWSKTFSRTPQRPADFSRQGICLRPYSPLNLIPPVHLLPSPQRLLSKPRQQSTMKFAGVASPTTDLVQKPRMLHIQQLFIAVAPIRSGMDAQLFRRRTVSVRIRKSPFDESQNGDHARFRFPELQ